MKRHPPHPSFPSGRGPTSGHSSQQSSQSSPITVPGMGLSQLFDHRTNPNTSALQFLGARQGKGIDWTPFTDTAEGCVNLFSMVPDLAGLIYDIDTVTKMHNTLKARVTKSRSNESADMWEKIVK